MRRDTDVRRDAMDLNQLTIVPVHGASQYRYSLHLTRGRGFDRPAVVVMLDSDPAGREVRPDLELGYKGEQIIDPKLIFAVGDLDRTKLTLGVDEVQEPEDLLPVGIARAAVVRFARDVLGPEAAENFVQRLAQPLVIPPTGRLYDGLEAAVETANAELAAPLSIGKVELARSIADLLNDPEREIDAGTLGTLGIVEPPASTPEADQDNRATVASVGVAQKNQAPRASAGQAAESEKADGIDPADLKTLHDNFAELFRVLNRLQAEAMREATDEQVRQLTKRLVERFKRDHRTRATKHAFANMVAELESQLLGVTEETERIRGRIRSYREEYKLGEDPATDIDGFGRLRGLLTHDLVYGGIRNQEGAGGPFPVDRTQAIAAPA